MVKYAKINFEAMSNILVAGAIVTLLYSRKHFVAVTKPWHFQGKYSQCDLCGGFGYHKRGTLAIGHVLNVSLKNVKTREYKFTE